MNDEVGNVGIFFHPHPLRGKARRLPQVFEFESGFSRIRDGDCVETVTLLLYRI